MTVYISGKITNNPSYLTDFEGVENRLADEFEGVINPAYTLKDMPVNTPYGDYIRICLALIDSADVVYMMRNWEESKGARFEHEYAEIMGKEIFYE